MTVKNVIRGIRREYDPQELNIISLDEGTVYFSGDPAGWDDAEGYLLRLKTEIDRAPVLNRIMFNHRKAFIFIPPIAVPEV